MNRVLILAFFILIAACGKRLPGDTRFSGSAIPEFKIHMGDSSIINTVMDLPFDSDIVLFFFDPNCTHCQAQLKSIIKDYRKLSAIKIYMIAVTSFEDLNRFKDQFGLSKYNNIKVGLDSSYVSATYFGINAVPFTAVYNRKHLLKRTFSGRIDGDLIYQSVIN